MSQRRLLVNEWARSHITDHITPAIQIVYNAYFGDVFFLKIEEGAKKSIAGADQELLYIGPIFERIQWFFTPKMVQGPLATKWGLQKIIDMYQFLYRWWNKQ